jgi:hypothetical protein
MLKNVLSFAVSFLKSNLDEEVIEAFNERYRSNLSELQIETMLEEINRWVSTQQLPVYTHMGNHRVRYPYWRE